MTTYTVAWAANYKQKVNGFATLQDAVIFARERAVSTTNVDIPVAVWKGLVVVAVVTDDASGLTVRRLNTWPADETCAY